MVLKEYTNVMQDGEFLLENDFFVMNTRFTDLLE